MQHTFHWFITSHDVFVMVVLFNHTRSREAGVLILVKRCKEQHCEVAVLLIIVYNCICEKVI
jgi:hypothetical protein